MLWYSEGAYWINTAGFMSGGAGLIRYILRTGIHGLDTDFELLGHNGIVGVCGGRPNPNNSVVCCVGLGAVSRYVILY